ASHAVPVLSPPEMLPATPPSGVQLVHVPSGTHPPPHPELPLPAPPQAQFNVPGSASGPAYPAMGIVSTKHGYASAAMTRGDLSYPRYEVPDALTSDVQLTPNRRPLFIGLGIIVVGVIVLLVVAFSGGGDEPSIAPVAEDHVEQMP